MNLNGQHTVSHRVSERKIIEQALGKAAVPGSSRHNSAVHLACQLRDNRYDRDEAYTIGLADFLPVVRPWKERDFSDQEWEKIVDDVYSSPRREPWGTNGISGPAPIERGFARHDIQEGHAEDPEPEKGLVRAKIRSAHERHKTPKPPTEFHVDTLFAKGGVHLVNAAPKIGKTTFTGEAIRAIIHGQPFLDFETSPASILYLSEQSEASFENEYLERLGLSDCENLDLLYRFETIGHNWHYVIEEAIDYAVENGIEIIVVDTFAAFSGLTGDQENSSGAVNEALAPVLHGSHSHGLTFILIHHDRKGGGTVEESGRGSSALPASVDVILNLKRSNLGPKCRELTGTGRFGEIPSLAIEMTDDGYMSHGPADDTAHFRAERAALETSPTSESEAIDVATLLKRTKKPRGFGERVLRKTLNELVDNEKMQRVGKGKAGDPYRYWRRMDSQDGRRSPEKSCLAQGNPIDARHHTPTTEELFSGRAQA